MLPMSSIRPSPAVADDDASQPWDIIPEQAAPEAQDVGTPDVADAEPESRR